MVVPTDKLPTEYLIKRVREMAFFEALNGPEVQKKLREYRAELQRRSDPRWKMGY